MFPEITPDLENSALIPAGPLPPGLLPPELLPTGPRDGEISIAVLDPMPERRDEVCRAVYWLRSANLLPTVSPIPWVGNPHLLLNQSFDIVLVAVDGPREASLQMIETLCRDGSVTVMAYSQSADDDLLIQCMRAGVREFLYYPFGLGVVSEAFHRAIRHRKRIPESTPRVSGTSFVFVGSKGGAGVTMAASNFAISLARESGKGTVLIDLDLPLGDAALNLGVASEFSTIDALMDIQRLDATLLRKLTVQHSSGLHVLPGPDKPHHIVVEPEMIDKLIQTAGEAFEYVVVDAGCRWELAESRLLDEALKVYLVTQVGVPELRNANRLLMGDLSPYASKVEIVLNRSASPTFGIDDNAIETALMRTPQWRIPNNYQAVRDMQITARPLVLKESGIQKTIQQMARAAAGLPLEKEAKRKIFNLFGSRRIPETVIQALPLGVSPSEALDQVG